MIPLTLKLVNFLSYGAELTMVDFSDLQVACLSGANGAGKTALLEALTWALWGKARGGSIEPEKLLNSSAKGNGGGMRVECEFFHDGERYRLERSFQKKGKTGSSTLTLSVWDRQRERFRLWSAGVRDTQDLLLELLGLDYETFITSSFIIQGQADRFHRASDAEKKEILAKILALSVYERLEESARAEAVLLRERREMLAAERRHLLKDLPQEKTLQDELSLLSKKKGEQTTMLGERRERVQTLNAELAELDGRLNRLERAGQEKEGLAKELAQVDNRRQEIETELGKIERLLSQGEEILARAERKKVLCREVERHNRLLSERNRLTGEIAAIDLTIAQSERKIVSQQAAVRELRANLLGEMRNIDATLAEERGLLLEVREKPHLLRKLAELSERLNRLNSWKEEAGQIQQKISAEYGRRQEELENLHRKLSLMETREEELAKLREDHGQQSRMVAEQKRNRERLASLRQELEVCRRAESVNEEKMLAAQKRRQTLNELYNLAETPGGNCPLCRQELSPAGRAAIGTHLAEEEGLLSREEQELQNEKMELEKSSALLARKIKDREDELEHLSAKTESFPALNQEIERLQAELKEKAGIAQAAEELGQLLAQGKGLAPLLEERCSELAAKILELQHIPDLYNQAQQKLSALNTAEERLGGLALCRKRRLEIKNQVKELENELDELKKSIECKDYSRELLSARAELAEALEQIAYDQPAHRRLERELASLPDVEQEVTALIKAGERNSPLRALLAELSEQSQRSRERLGELEGQISELPSARRRWAVAKKEQEELTAVIFALEKEGAELQTQEGAWREKLSAAAKNRKRAEELRGKILELTGRERTALLLAGACGKRGVQARMIESVLPELEREANSILTLLSGGSLRLKLVTQLKTKSGNEREVLRIVVSAGDGERPFELYSGGEAFRISFALRLAISALATGGRGESRPLLVVDEGFGTQDAEGLNALVEAIGRVSAGFGLILVITHLEELKSRFERVIEVERDERGFSRVRLAG
jgi:exonuclease SbcC